MVDRLRAGQGHLPVRTCSKPAISKRKFSSFNSPSSSFSTRRVAQNRRGFPFIAPVSSPPCRRRLPRLLDSCRIHHHPGARDGVRRQSQRVGGRPGRLLFPGDQVQLAAEQVQERTRFAQTSSLRRGPLAWLGHFKTAVDHVGRTRLKEGVRLSGHCTSAQSRDTLRGRTRLCFSSFRPSWSTRISSRPSCRGPDRGWPSTQGVALPGPGNARPWRSSSRCFPRSGCGAVTV